MTNKYETIERIEDEIRGMSEDACRARVEAASKVPWENIWNDSGLGSPDSYAKDTGPLLSFDPDDNFVMVVIKHNKSSWSLFAERGDDPACMGSRLPSMWHAMYYAILYLRAIRDEINSMELGV